MRREYPSFLASRTKMWCGTLSKAFTRSSSPWAYAALNLAAASALADCCHAATCAPLPSPA